jgi:hypothetical protein
MKKKHIENKNESTLITDDDGLIQISNILNSHSKLYIEYPDIEIPIETSSILKICKLADFLPEENILFAYRCHNNSQINYEEEDSFMQTYRNKPKQNQNIFNDSDDILIELNTKELNDQYSKIKQNANIGFKKLNDNQNNAFDNHSLSNTVANSNELEQNVLDSMKNKTFFEKNISFFLLLWEGLYELILLIGVLFFCHISFFAHNQGSIMSVYLTFSVFINLFIFIVGFVGLYHIKIEKTQKINETNVNLLLLILVAFTVINFIFGEYIMKPPVQDYLLKETNFLYLYICLMFNEVSALVMNFKMNQFYVEYNFLLPLKYPLLNLGAAVDYLGKEND